MGSDVTITQNKDGGWDVNVGNPGATTFKAGVIQKNKDGNYHFVLDPDL